MVLIREITIDNFAEFKGLVANILVVENKEGPVRMRHSFYLIGLVVNLGPLFRVHFSNGKVSGFENSIKELIDRQSGMYKFFYIEIKP